MNREEFLADKKVIVTGGSSGIGKTIAINFAQMGADIGLMARSEDKLKDVVSQIKSKGQDAYYSKTDITNYAEVTSGLQDLTDNLGGFDVLVNNAGAMRRTNFKNFRQDQIDLIVDTNIKGAMYAALESIKIMLEAGGGSIINTGSVSAVTPVGGMAVYGASKSALSYFSQTLGIELESDGIRVNTLLCGFIDTPMFRYGLTDKMAKALDPMLPEDLVPYYAFFASDISKRVNSTLVNVDDMRKMILPVVSELEHEKRESWRDLKRLFKKKLPPKLYKHAKSNKQIIKFMAKRES